MKVHELLEALEGVDEDTEVYFAYQPTYPMQERVTDVVYSEDVVRDDGEEPIKPRVWLVNSWGGNEYAPRAVFG